MEYAGRGAGGDVAWDVRNPGDAVNDATVVIFAGLLAGLASAAAWREGGGAAPSGLRWRLAESPVSVITLILAWVMTAYAGPGVGLSFLLGGPGGFGDGAFGDVSQAPLVFGLLLVLTPLIHRALTLGGGSGRWGFGITAGVVAWAAFSVIIISAIRIAGLIDGYPVIPRLILLGLLAAAVLGALVRTALSLQSAAANAPAPWTLP